MAKARKRSGRPPAEEAALIPERLLDAAMQLFIADGYAGTTMDAIARKAGASSKTVYSRYANKEAVLTAVVRRLLDRALADAPPAAAEAALADPRDVLIRLAHELAGLSAARDTAGLNRLIMAEAFRFPELARLFIDLHHRAAAAVRAPLERWQAAGLLPDLPSPRLAAMLFVEMAASLPRIHALLGAPLTRRQTADLTAAAVDLFLRGCGYRER